MIGEERPQNWSKGNRQAISHEFSATATWHFSAPRSDDSIHANQTRRRAPKAVLFAVLYMGGICTSRQLHDFVRQTHTLQPDRTSRKRPYAARVVSSLRADGPIFVSIAAFAAKPSAATKTRLLPRPNIALAVCRTARIDARCNQVGARQHSDPLRDRQSPGLVRTGERNPLPTPSGPPSPTTTPNSTEWRKDGIAIVNIVLDAPITRPIPHYFQAERTRYEHSGARSSETIHSEAGAFLRSFRGRSQ